MRKRYGWAVAGAALMVAGAGVALAAGQAPSKAAPSAAPWIHVRVQEPRRESSVNVNLPLGVVQAALAAAPDRVMSNGQFHVHTGHDLSVADMRRIWSELKKAPDGEMVTVDDKDEHVRVARRGDRLEVRTDKSGGQQVRVDMPLAVVDALFGGQGESLDMAAAITELQKIRGDIVTVHDEQDTSVHIWIDSEPGSTAAAGSK